MDCFRRLRTDTLDGVSHCEIVVARVLASRDGDAVHDTFPTALLQVEEVLHGDIDPGPLQAVWGKHRPEFLCGNDRSPKEPFLSNFVPGPIVGSRLIVAGDLNRSRRWFNTSEYLRVPFTRQTRQAVLRRLKEEEGPETVERREQQARNRAENRAAVRDDELCDAVQARDAQRVYSLLREGVRPTARDERGISALVKASGLGTLEMMRMLIEGGALSDEKTRQRQLDGSLMFAARSGQLEAMQFLLAQGANPDQPEALMMSLSSRQCAALKALLSAGARPNSMDYQRQLPLAAAIKEGSLDCARALVEAGADLNRADDYGDRPLHIAVAHPEVLKMLLRAGADPHLRNARLLTPLGEAFSRNAQSGMRVLQEAGIRE